MLQSVSRVHRILSRGCQWQFHEPALGKIWIILVCGNSRCYKRLFELRNSYFCEMYECQCNVLSSQIDWDCTVLEVENTTVCRFINKVGSPETKFATHGSASVMVISFVFWWVKYDVWASAFQMSLHWRQGPVSLGKGNHFLFCLLSYEMEEGAAEVGESQMDITLTFEEWKANKRVTGEEGKLNLPFQSFFFPLYLSWLSCAVS